MAEARVGGTRMAGERRMLPTCSMDVRTVRGVKNALFGGEGFFHTVVTGPGHVVVQTMSVVEFTARIAALVPSKD